MSESLCGGFGGNTGRKLCDKRRGKPVVPLLGNKAFEPADYATAAAFQAAVIAAINLPEGDTDKLYPFPEVQSNTNQTEEKTVGTTGYGFKMILKKGKPAYRFGVLVGSSQEKQLRKFNNQIVPVFIFDDAADVCGVLDATDNFVGALALIDVEGKPYSNGNDVEQEYTNVDISFLSEADFYDKFAFVHTSFTPSALEGLVDAELYTAAAVAANVYKIGARLTSDRLDAEGTVNLFDKYGTELADDALWAVSADGDPLTLTSVAVDNVNKCWTVTIDNTEHTALASGDEIQFKWVGPAALLAAGVRGLESVALIVEKA